MSLRDSFKEFRYSESTSLPSISSLISCFVIGDLAIVSAKFCRFRSRFSVSYWRLITVPTAPSKMASVTIRMSCERKSIRWMPLSVTLLDCLFFFSLMMLMCPPSSCLILSHIVYHKFDDISIKSLTKRLLKVK